MQWKDVSIDDAQWCYTSTKRRKEVIVPLSRQAVDILSDLQPLTGEGKYVFPGMRGGRPIGEMAIVRALQFMGYDTKTEHTAHGFRATARTILRERLGIDAEIIEFQLSHETKNPLGGAYDRALFIDERRRMMQQWADYLDRLKSGESAVAV
jgi:integrase